MKFNSTLFTKFYLLAFFIGLSFKSFAQVGTTYGFSQTVGIFTPIVNGTVLGVPNNDDQSFCGLTTQSNTGNGFPIGFPFEYNGQVFDKFAINTNGWIRLDTGNFNLPFSYTPISSPNTNHKNIISAFGKDIQGNTNGELSYGIDGTAPNRILVVQWLNYKKFGSFTTDTINFQLRLQETTNKIEFVYGKCVTNAISNSIIQVGIKGSFNSDFSNRITSSDWVATSKGLFNNDNCFFTATVTPISGLTFSYQKLFGDITPPVISSINFSSISTCVAVPRLVSATITDSSGIDSANLIYSLNGVVQPLIGMLKNGSLFTATIPAAGNSNVTFIISAKDSSINNNETTSSINSYSDQYLSILAGPDQTINAGSSVLLTASSPFSNSLKITEVTLFNIGTSSQTVYPSYMSTSILQDDNVEITNLSTSSLDVSGYSLNYYNHVGTKYVFTFPTGTIIPAGEIATVHFQFGPGVNDLINRYFYFSNVSSFSSGSMLGLYIANNNAEVLDAISVNGFIFPTNSPVTLNDYSGSSISSPAGFSGVQLNGFDQNSSANWNLAIGSIIGSQGFQNAGLTLSNTPIISFFGGLFTNSVSGNSATSPIHTQPGSYTYFASITDSNCVAVDSTIITVISPLVPVASFDVNQTSGFTGGVVTTFNLNNTSTNLPTSFLWYFDPQTVNYVNGTNQNSNNPSVTFNSVGIYSATLIATNLLGSDTLTKLNYISIQNSLCASSATSTIDDDIGNVTFGSLNNGSDTVPLNNNTTSINTYSNFDTLSIQNFAAGASYSFAATQINSSVFFSCDLAVFIDYNQNGVFNINEKAFSGVSTRTDRVFDGVITIPVSAVLGTTNMRVVLNEIGAANACGNYTWGETEDYLINITSSSAIDGGISAILSPNSGCSLTSTNSVTVKIVNNSFTPMSNFNVNYSINGGAPITEVINDTLPALADSVYTFATTVDLSAAGSYILTSTITLVGDSNSTNNFLTKTIENNPKIVAFPYTQDFSTKDNWVATQVSGTGLFTIKSSMTSPFLNPTFGTGLAVFNSFNYISGTSSRFYYGCGFDFSTLIAPKVELYVSQDFGFSTFDDYIAVDISTNNGNTWIAIDSIKRNNPLFIIPGFTKFDVDLSAYAGSNNIMVALRGVSRFGNNISVDQFKIMDPLPRDIGVTAVMGMQSGCGLSTTTPVLVKIKNFGNQAITNFSISYRIDLGTEVTESANMMLAPNSEAIYQFSTLADLSILGMHTLEVYTKANLDGDPSNDKKVTEMMTYSQAAQPVVSNVSVCIGEQAVLSASGNSNTYKWYDAAIGGNLVSTGSSFSMLASSTTNLYVEAFDKTNLILGAPNNTIGDRLAQNPVGEGLLFNVTKEITIDSIALIVNAIGTININLKNNFGALVANYSFTITKIGKQFIPLNLTLQPAFNYSITAISGSTVRIERNSEGASFPYITPSITITDGTLSGFYYYFYDWHISTPNCPSARTLAQITVNQAPVVDLGSDQAICPNSVIILDAINTGNTYLWSTGETSRSITVNSPGVYEVEVSNASGCVAVDNVTVYEGAIENPQFISSQIQGTTTVGFVPSSFQGSHTWYFGIGNTVSNDPSPTFLFPNIGGIISYGILHKIISYDGCESISIDTIQVTGTSGFSTTNASTFNMKIYPNPLQATSVLSYDLIKRSQVQVSVLDMAGRVVYSQNVANQDAGQHLINLSKIFNLTSSGLYEIRVVVDGTSATKRMVVE